MTSLSHLFRGLEKFVVGDPKLLFTLTSYVLVPTIYLNLNIRSPAVGIVSFILYFSINGTFLAHAFFEREDVFFRLMFGVLSLIMLLSFVGWLIMLIHNLDAPLFSLALFIVSTFSSLSNRRKKHENVA